MNAHEGRQEDAVGKVSESAGRLRDPATPVGNTIFVSIAAYRDAECVPTIADLFQKAARPTDIAVGVCWQFLPGRDPENLDLGSFANRVRVLSVDAAKSRGICWARHQAEQFFSGEDYVLQIDSHTRFVPNWDDLMCEELARCDAARAALSCNPPPYRPPCALEPNPRPILKRPVPFNGRGDLRLRPEYLDAFPDAPIQTAFASSSFIFGRGELLREIPADPWLYFDQEEVTYSLRLFTHGWNVYGPSRVLLYRCYDDARPQESRPPHWQDCPGWRTHQKIGLTRFNHLTEFASSSDPNVLVDLEKYSLGTTRSLDEFQSFSGIDFRKKIVHDHGLRMQFIPGIDRLRKSPLQDPPRTSPVNSPAGHSQAMPASPPRGYRFTTAPWKLEIGDFVPFFSLPAIQDGRPREIHHFAGKPIVLFFVNNPAHPDVPRFHELLTPFSAELADSVWSICIIPDALKGNFQEKSCGRVWLDGNGSIAKSFGFGLDSQSVSLGGWSVLTPNLRVAAVAPIGPLGEAFEQVRSSLETLRRDSGRKVQALHAPVLLVNDVLPPASCQSLIHYWSTGNRYDGRVGGSQTYDPGSKIRTDCVLNGDARAEVDQLLARKLLPEIYKVFNIKVTRREPYKLGVYSAEKGGFFRPHRDNFEPAMYYRRLALSINLNDDFDGGGVVFPEYSDDMYCPGPGCALVFPCGLVHGVNRVTRGERFMMVGFLYSEEEHQKRKQCNDPTLRYDDRLLAAW